MKYEHAPDVDEIKLCDWEFHPRAYYSDQELDDIDDEEVKFKCDLLVSFKIEDKIQSYFIKYIDKDYDIRKYMELIKKFDTFVKDEELVDRYCIISDKKPKLVFIADTQELMQDLFNTIINYDIDFNKKIIVIGNEANGVSKEIQEMADEKVKIPMLGKTESLNASVAAGIVMYEYVRQKVSKK